MTRKTWLIIAVTITIWICLFPFVVLGEGSTYVVIPQNECIDHAYNANYYWKFSGSGELRAAIVSIGSGRENTVIVSTMPFTYSRISSGADKLSACIAATPTTNANYYNQNGYSFYYYGVYTNGINPFNIPSFHFNSGEVHEKAYELTFGELAEGPEEPVNWGILKDVQYQTRVAGQGEASKKNLDYMFWDKAVDTNGNNISECQVEIQAVYGKFTGNDLVDLYEKDLEDLAIQGTAPLGVVNADAGQFVISWEDVVERLNGWTYDSLFAHQVSQQIEKNGWYYQMRLVTSDGHEGQWQLVYTPLASSAKDSETVLNATSYSMSVYQVYEHITQINNQTSITVTINDTEYTIQNPDDGDEPEEGTDYWDILRQMLNGIIQIVGNIQKLPQLIGEKVQELVTPPQDYEESLTNQYNQEVNDYLEYHQPTIFEILDEMDNMQEQITSYAPEDQGAHQCILYWEDVALDLTPFGAGNVVFLQAGQHNLTETFLSLLHAFDLTYADYETLVSAIIYLWLLVFIWRHFIKFLEKD